MPTGIVKRFALSKGFGFVTPDDGGSDIFLHATELAQPRGEAWRLERGIRVEFALESGPKGPRAVHATIPGDQSSPEFRRLINLARESARAFNQTGVSPQLSPGDVSGWMVLERLVRTDITYAPRKGAKPRYEEKIYDEIWLVSNGDLRQVRRSEVDMCNWVDGTVVGSQRSQSAQPSELIASVEDIRYGWDGDYYRPVTDRFRTGETIGMGLRSGPLEHPATRIAERLDLITKALQQPRPAP